LSPAEDGSPRVEQRRDVGSRRELVVRRPGREVALGPEAPTHIPTKIEVDDLRGEMRNIVPWGPAPSFSGMDQLSGRLARLADWVVQATGSRTIYISDAEGLPLVVRGVNEVQAAFPVVLGRAMRSLAGLLESSPVGSVSIELEGGRVVQTIWGTTSIGRVAIGLFPPFPVELQRVDEIRRALGRAFES
jgi:hypothetical protein